MRKHYETDWATLWHADARDVLGEVPTESVDLVLTDPPYGISYRSNMRSETWEIQGDGGGDDERGVVLNVLRECVRAVGQRRHLYVFGSDVLGEAGEKVSQGAELIWRKQAMGSGDLSSAWGKQHETIWFYVSMHRHGGKRGKELLPVRMRKGSVLDASRRTGRTLRHPTEKPLGLLQELIESSSRQGEVVLDPFAGVGSTGVAAILAGRRAILVEKDAQWLDVASERLREAERLRLEGASV